MKIWRYIGLLSVAGLCAMEDGKEVGSSYPAAIHQDVQPEHIEAMKKAIERGNLPLMQRLLRIGVPINTTDAQGKNFLHYAAHALIQNPGNSTSITAAIGHLIDQGCDIKKRDTGGRNPWWFAQHESSKKPELSGDIVGVILKVKRAAIDRHIRESGMDDFCSICKEDSSFFGDNPAEKLTICDLGCLNVVCVKCLRGLKPTIEHRELECIGGDISVVLSTIIRCPFCKRVTLVA